MFDKINKEPELSLNEEHKWSSIFYINFRNERQLSRFPATFLPRSAYTNNLSSQIADPYYFTGFEIETWIRIWKLDGPLPYSKNNKINQKKYDHCYLFIVNFSLLTFLQQLAVNNDHNFVVNFRTFETIFSSLLAKWIRIRLKLIQIRKHWGFFFKHYLQR